MEHGTIVRWLKDAGEVVERGEDLVEIETDKATMPYEAETGGPLEIVVGQGETVSIGTVIGRIGEDASAPGATSTSAAHDPATASATDTRIVELSSIQSTIARRMTDAAAAVPAFSLTIDVDMEPAVDLRAHLRRRATDDAPPPTFNDIVVKAAAMALRQVPRANGAFRDGHFALHDRVNVGVAVATEDALVVPVVTDADRQGLAAIAKATHHAAARVRQGEITPAELAGGTFTVSNLGMLGVAAFTSIVNSGQAAILSVGAIREAPVVRDGAVAPGKLMSLTLTCDHRILYGADGARLLEAIRRLLEDPGCLET
jgi:pyruvate dehydrogenase E2 component (dihydrolipoamide acetyltransferase)